MKLAVLAIVLGTATTAFADDYDICVARRHVLEAQIRESPPNAQVALERELPVCREATPPLSGGRLAGELVLGAAAGLAGGFAGGMIGYEFQKGSCTGEEWCGLGGFIVGGYLGATLAPPVAVYLVGASGDQTGSPAATAIGALLGGGLGLAAGVGAGRANGWLGFTIAMAGPVVGSMVGFNLTRRYRDAGPAPVPGSLVRVDGGRVAIGVPLVVRSSKDGMVGLSLASGSF